MTVNNFYKIHDIEIFDGLSFYFFLSFYNFIMIKKYLVDQSLKKKHKKAQKTPPRTNVYNTPSELYYEVLETYFDELNEFLYAKIRKMDLQI